MQATAAGGCTINVITGTPDRAAALFTEGASYHEPLLAEPPCAGVRDAQRGIDFRYEIWAGLGDIWVAV